MEASSCESEEAPILLGADTPGMQCLHTQKCSRPPPLVCCTPEKDREGWGVERERSIRSWKRVILWLRCIHAHVSGEGQKRGGAGCESYWCVLACNTGTHAHGVAHVRSLTSRPHSLQKNLPTLFRAELPEDVFISLLENLDEVT